MAPSKYGMSFIVGGLFFNESIQLAELYVELSDWKTTREQAVATNLFQANKISSLRRIVHEVSKRLSALTHAELVFFTEASVQEQKQLVWLAICRRYRFVAEFAEEVLRENFLALKNQVTHDDFEAFFNRKAEWAPELEQLAVSTKQRVRPIIFKLMTEADLITKGRTINPAIFSSKMLAILQEDSSSDLRLFPSFEGAH